MILWGAIDKFSTTIASCFLGLSSASTDEVLEAYARDYLYALPVKDKEKQVASSSPTAGRSGRGPERPRSGPGAQPAVGGRSRG